MPVRDRRQDPRRERAQHREDADGEDDLMRPRPSHRPKSTGQAATSTDCHLPRQIPDETRGHERSGASELAGAASVCRTGIPSRSERDEKLLHASLVGFAEALGHAGQHLARKAGNLVDDAGELALTEYDELHVGLGYDAGVAGRLLEQRELPEGVARAE